MEHWIESALIYHLLPLAALGAPKANPGGDPVPRIRQLAGWIDPARRIGADTLLLGPLWESVSHGYDTTDYTVLDRRLGTNADLAEALAAWKAAGFRLVFDGVFNHCGRGFGPFVDLVAHGRHSAYRDWFAGIDFDQRSPLGDPFGYEGWAGHHSLVKYNLKNPDLKARLFEAVGGWIDRYDLDGLRLDAADVMDHDFLRELAMFCRSQKSDFWLMGEVVHGDYRQWAPGAGLDAVTNYELYKGMWSSLHDGNYFEVAWSLNRQFGPEGVYRGQLYSTFGDNHDVDRVASSLDEPAHLYPHAIVQATVPGVPTVYYGSEAGISGKRTAHSDDALRPALTPGDVDTLPQQALRGVWARLAGLRRRLAALRTGDYAQAFVAGRQFAFWRRLPGAEPVLVVVNAAANEAVVEVPLGAGDPHGAWADVLNPADRFDTWEGRLVVPVARCWGRILVPHR
jgi:cyclomaltodextrinase